MTADMMNKAKAEELGLEWLCEIGAHGVVAGPDSTLQSQPVIEINEAFSAVTLASTKELGIDGANVNTLILRRP